MTFLKLSDFDYDLPQDLVAQHPAPRRDASRLLAIDRASGTLEHGRFTDIVTYARRDDLFVFNDTKVSPARLLGRRRTGGKVEVLLLEKVFRHGQKGEFFRALIRPLGRLKTGEEIFFGRGHSCVLEDPKEKIVAFRRTAAAAMKAVGVLPLPPYIRRPATAADRKRYQTVYARRQGAVAAPTAGLHFTRALLNRLVARQAKIAYVTLHVNYATFSPVHADEIKDHRMASESFEIPAATVAAVRRARDRGGRVIAVGTTTAKTLEDQAALFLSKDKPKGASGQSRLFIYPPFDFKVTDALITNFHLPRTTLLMLVSAFAGRDLVLRAYRAAVEARYRFYSYGDAMFIF